MAQPTDFHVVNEITIARTPPILSPSLIASLPSLTPSPDKNVRGRLYDNFVNEHSPAPLSCCLPYLDSTSQSSVCSSPQYRVSSSLLAIVQFNCSHYCVICGVPPH